MKVAYIITLSLLALQTTASGTVVGGQGMTVWLEQLGMIYQLKTLTKHGCRTVAPKPDMGSSQMLYSQSTIWEVNTLKKASDINILAQDQVEPPWWTIKQDMKGWHQLTLESWPSYSCSGLFLYDIPSLFPSNHFFLWPLLLHFSIFSFSSVLSFLCFFSFLPYNIW